MADQNLKFKVLASVAGTQAVDGLKNSVDGVTKAVKLLAVAYAAKEAVQYVKNIINMGDELQALSEKTGISAQKLYGFKIAAQTANLDIESLSGALSKFTVNLSGVATGNDKVAKSLGNLGVSAFDSGGKLRSSGDVIIDLADKFKNMADGPEKARLAVELFGKQGTALIPFLNQGSEALKEFSDAFGPDFAARADGFNDSLALMGAKLQVLGIKAAETLLPTLQEVANAFLKLPTSSKEVVGAFDVIGEAVRLLAIGFKVFLDAFINGIDLMVTVARAGFTQLAGTFSQLTDSLTTKAAQLKAIATANFDEVGKLQDEFNARTVSRDAETLSQREKLYADFGERSKKRFAETVDFTNKLAKNSLLFGDGSVDEIKKRAAAETAPAARPASAPRGDLSGLGSAGSKAESEIEQIRKYIEVQKEEIAQEAIKLEAYKYSKVEFEKLTEAKKIDIEITKKSAGFTAEGKQQFLEAAEAVKKQRLALIDLEQAQRESFGVGAKQAFNEYIEGVKDVASQTKQLFTNAFKGMEDSLVSFVKTGKLDFASLADSIISDMIRIAIRQAVLGPLLSAAGGLFGGGVAAPTGGGAPIVPIPNANGGIMTSRGKMNLSAYSNGGIANSPQLALFGEDRTPEAYVPLPDGKRIPVAMKGGGGNNVTVNITTNVESGQSTSESSNESGAALGKVIAGAVQAELIKQKRPGGLLAG